MAPRIAGSWGDPHRNARGPSATPDSHLTRVDGDRGRGGTPHTDAPMIALPPDFRRLIVIALVFLLPARALHAQQPLTLDEALQRASVANAHLPVAALNTEIALRNCPKRTPARSHG